MKVKSERKIIKRKFFDDAIDSANLIGEICLGENDDESFKFHLYFLYFLRQQHSLFSENDIV